MKTKISIVLFGCICLLFIYFGYLIYEQPMADTAWLDYEALNNRAKEGTAYIIWETPLEIPEVPHDTIEINLPYRITTENDLEVFVGGRWVDINLIRRK